MVLGHPHMSSSAPRCNLFVLIKAEVVSLNTFSFLLNYSRLRSTSIMSLLPTYILIYFALIGIELKLMHPETGRKLQSILSLFLPWRTPNCEYYLLQGNSENCHPRL